MIDLEREPLARRAFEEFTTGRFTQEEVCANVTRFGLRNRRGRKLTSQPFGRMLQNKVYAGIIVVPDYGISGNAGIFPLRSSSPYGPSPSDGTARPDSSGLSPARSCPLREVQ